MPWRTKFDSYASMKKKSYEEAENILSTKKNGMEANLTSIRIYMKTIKSKIEDMGALSGDYLYKYETKRDDYLLKYISIMKGFENYINDLEQTISQCNSKKQEWNSKIYTTYWEPELEER